jgi:hypothetical protein
MKYFLLASAATALLTFTAVSLADPPSRADRQSAAQRCRAQRDSMGQKAFRDLYATNKKKSNGFGRCIAKLTQHEASNQDNAAKQCKAERDGDSAAFADKYGTNANKRNAFGKCVSMKAKAQSDDEQEATIEAAKACKTERAKDPAAFRAKYAKGHNKKNAFGKCVSAKVNEQ